LIDHDVVDRTLATALRNGGDFAELFAEDKRSSSAVFDDGRVEELTSGRDRGVGIRVVVGDTTGPIAALGTFREEAVNASVFGRNQAEAVKLYDRAGWR